MDMRGRGLPIRVSTCVTKRREALFKRYEALAVAAPDVIFVGRLATYRYYDMAQMSGQALATHRRHVTALALTMASSEEATAVAAEWPFRPVSVVTPSIARQPAVIADVGPDGNRNGVRCISFRQKPKHLRQAAPEEVQ